MKIVSRHIGGFFHDRANPSISNPLPIDFVGYDVCRWPFHTVFVRWHSAWHRIHDAVLRNIDKNTITYSQ